LRQYELMRKLIKTMAKGRITKFGPLGKLLKQMPKEMSREKGGKSS